MTDARDHVAIKLDLIGDTLYLVILGAAYPYRSTTATVTKVTKCYVTYRKADLMHCNGKFELFASKGLL